MPRPAMCPWQPTPAAAQRRAQRVGGGVPAAADADSAHDVMVAALARTNQHALRHAGAAGDLIVAQGAGTGGHTGEVATTVLVSEVVDLDSQRPLGRLLGPVLAL